MPSTFGTLTPAIVVLAPVAASTRLSTPLPEWATMSIVPPMTAWMPLLLNAPLRSAAGPLSVRVVNVLDGTPSTTGTK